MRRVEEKRAVKQMTGRAGTDERRAAMRRLRDISRKEER